MKNQPSQALSEQEIEWLDNFLSNRFDEEDYVEGMDEGIFCISALDGFFAAIVSGPDLIPPSVWLPSLAGDHEEVWDSEEQINQVLGLLMRHMNGIADALLRDPACFEPLFLERQVEGKTYTIVDEWCEGYLRGISLNPRAWDLESETMVQLLAPMLLFGSSSGDRVLDANSDEQVAQLQDRIAPNVAAIHAYWLARREPPLPGNLPFRHDSPRVGRNDPCPCGSGKKYKKCCLH